MDMKKDRYGYLRKSGAIGVSHKAIAVSGSTRGKGSLGSSSVETKGLAKRANIEGNESKMYEKLEKRSLRSLKEGGSEKELRRGHNSFGDVMKKSHGLGLFGGGDSGPSAAELRQRARKRRVTKVAKSGVAVDAAKNPMLAARVGRKQDIMAAKASGGDVKAARQAGTAGVKAAKKIARGMTGAEKKSAKSTFKATTKLARKGFKEKDV